MIRKNFMCNRYLTKFVKVARALPIRLRSDLTKVTHTGQVWSEDDYRNARFNNSKRYVNEKFGIKFASKIPIIVSNERVVYCDGNGPLGHPRVYINLDLPGVHYCHYCLQTFKRKTDSHSE